MATEKQFLDTYRRYESLARQSGTTPQMVEESFAEADPKKAGRLKICRQIRNYLTHADDPGFLPISDTMLECLESQANAMEEDGDIASKHLKKPSACVLSDAATCAEALEKLKKFRRFRLAVSTPKGYQILNLFDLIGKPDGCPIAQARKSTKGLGFCSPTDPYGSLDKGLVILCTSDGTKNGKLLGQVWFPDAL